MSTIIAGFLAAIFLLGVLISLVSLVFCVFERDFNDKIGIFFGLLLFCLAGVVLILLFG